jgi:hypothetical protein
MSAGQLLRLPPTNRSLGPELGEESGLTFAAFLVAPAFPWGKGAGAGFFPLGGCH